MMNYSVLMSVYVKEHPEHFSKSIQSMLDQTIPTNDFVIICDGPLTPELDDVLSRFEKERPNLFNIHRFPKNQGLGNALRYGLLQCKNDLVARMDSDDYSMPTRCEKQLILFQNDDQLTVVGTNIGEFLDDPNSVLSTIVYPTDNEGIRKRLPYRSPFGHPSVMFRKEKILAVGSYSSLYNQQDYFLWARVLKANMKCANIPEILLRMRVDDKLYKRRSGYSYFKKSKEIQKFLLKEKMISWPRYIISVSIRFVVQVLMPNWLRKGFYKTFLRKRKKK